MIHLAKSHLDEFWDNVGIPRIYWREPLGNDSGVCLSIQLDGHKRFYRIWNPGTIQEVREWGWTLHPDSQLLVPTKDEK